MYIKRSLIGVTASLIVSSLIYAEVSNSASAAPAASSVAAPVARATKIAVVDPQKIIGESEEYRDKIAEMQAEFQKRVADLQKQEEELKKKARAASAPSASAAAPERDVMKDLAKKQKDIEIESRSLESEFQQRQQELQMVLAQKVDTAIETIAKDKWDAVIPKFFYASKDIDLTVAVTEQLNKDYKKAKSAAKFKKDSAAKTV